MSMINTQNIDNSEFLFIFKGNFILTDNKNEYNLPDSTIFKKCLSYQLATDWFFENDLHYSALLLEDSAPEPTGCFWKPIRELYAEKHSISQLISRAACLLNWRKESRFCGKCGCQLHESTDETARVCISCGSVFYPTLSPAIIVLVKKDNQILLARHKHRNTDVFTCLAGYVEAGESIEECVKREVKEEAGITIKNIQYKGSQSWPFPDQLMLAFTAEWDNGELSPQYSEINELKWFNKNNLPSIPKKGSVAYKLINEEF